MEQTQDLHVESIMPLEAPRSLKQRLPLTAAAGATVVAGRREIIRILTGEDNRLLVIVGPCSIHDPEAAIEYAGRLCQLRRDLGDRLCIVMRVYFEKPRTTVGWRGLINDPDLDGSCNISKGLETARRLLLAVNEMGLPAATEILDPVIPQYIADLITWTAIGARTTESQTHRDLVSGLSMPVGFKNSTDGNQQIAVDAMLAAKAPHSFLGVDQDGVTSLVKTTGNPNSHIVLRGGHDRPNYDEVSVQQTEDALAAAGLPPRIMVDCSHANSAKQAERQLLVLRSVINQRLSGTQALMGVMLESNLGAGRQDIASSPADMAAGVSITDACIDWETTATALADCRAALTSDLNKAPR